MKNVEDFINKPDDRYYGSINIASDTNVPNSSDRVARFKGLGIATIELNVTTNLDAEKTININRCKY